MISRNTLASLLVLMAGVITGYFTYRLTNRSPALHLQDSTLSGGSGTVSLSPSGKGRFCGSSLELSQLYASSRLEFEEVAGGGDRALQQARAELEALQRARDTTSLGTTEYERRIDSLEYRMDLLSMLDYYLTYFMHHYRWIDTGESSPSGNYQLALGQFRATVSYFRLKYPEHPDPEGMDLGAMLRGTRLAEQNPRAVRWARVLVVVLLFTLIMGIPRFIRESSHRKFAASLYFDALFRPMMVSDLGAWHALRRLAAGLVIAYLLGPVILSTFCSWKLPLLAAALGMLPVTLLSMLTSRSGKQAEILVSLMAPKVFILLVVLVPVAVRGPGFLCYRFWDSEVFRAMFLAVLGALVFHKYRVHAILARKWSHRNRRGSAAMVGMAMGLQLLAGGILLKAFGMEESLLSLNRDLALLPGGDPSVLGSMAWHGVPSTLPVWILVLASVLLVISGIIYLLNKKSIVNSSPQTPA